MLIAGCHPGECHYVDGNIKALRRSSCCSSACCAQLGIEEERVQVVWASASRATSWPTRSTDDRAVRALGPLQLGRTVLGGNGHGHVRAAAAVPAGEEGDMAAKANRSWPCTGPPRAAAARSPC